ncbi:MAG TPA: carboxypeptidase-like regulatory domain-containing protein [bacterium]|nr:carboxypeptidase-like regulatory domain-containing protein [bacterium]
MEKKFSTIAILLSLSILMFALLVGCDCGDDDDDNDDDATDDDVDDDDNDTTDDDTTDDDTTDDDTIDDDTIDDDTGDDDTGDDDTIDDDTIDDDTIDDDTGDDDTYPTHEEIFNVSGAVTVNGSSAIIEQWGLGSGYFSCRLAFVDTTTQEITTVWPDFEDDPGSYCASLLGGTYEVWILWNGYNNSSYQYFQYTTRLSAGLNVDADQTFDVNHIVYTVDGNVVNHTPEPVQYQKVQMFQALVETKSVFSEQFEYYDFTDDAGDYSITVPAGAYTFSVDVYDVGFDVLPYYEDGLNISAATTKNVALAQISSAYEVNASFTVNGEVPTTRYESVSATMTFYDTTHRVRYWDYCDGDCTIYAPAGSYQQQLNVNYNDSTGTIFSVDLETEFTGTVGITGPATLPVKNLTVIELFAAVTDYSGAAFADVEIDGSSGDGAVGFTATTDGSGQYHVDLPAGNYDFDFTPPASSPYPYTETDYNVTVSTDAVGDFAFPSGYATLDGEMTINGDPLTDYYPEIYTFAAVNLLDAEYNIVRQIDLDPATGLYSDVVPYGTYSVQPLYQSASTTDLIHYDYLLIYWSQYVPALTISGDLTQDIDFTLYAVDGTIRDWDTTPYQYASAYFDAEIDSLDDLVVFAEAYADAAGEYSTWLPAATYNLEFWPTECNNLIPLAAEQQDIAGDTTINFRFR